MNRIAIIGMAGEFPGAVSVRALWPLLAAGGDAIGPLPTERWRGLLPEAELQRNLAAIYCRYGGFLDQPFHFDPAFFGIAPISALKMDPQERRLLQTAWHALEDSGYFDQPVARTGVFTSAMFGHYTELRDPTHACATSFASIANRLSYAFDFSGPSLCLDTMCSGALAALHLAIRSLQQGECDMALAGSANITVHPGKYKILCDGRFLSKRGHCHSFGAAADGYVPGEGVICLVLKRYADAIRAQDRIHAVILGSAMNSVGRSGGSYNVPSVVAQEAVMRAALQDAAIDARTVSYIEAHGTGTPTGDPIEFQSLQRVYGDAPAYVGAVKSNIGHLEAAAGLASVVKVILQLQQRQIAPLPAFCAPPNPKLVLQDSRLKLADRLRDWPADVLPRTAGINAFGAGGTNVHLLLQEGPAAPPRSARTAPRALPFALSARTLTALTQKKRELADWLQMQPEVDLVALGGTLARLRAHHAHRQCLIAADRADLLAQLRDDAAPDNVAAGADVRALRTAYLAGERVDWTTLWPQRQFCDCPGYPFQGRLYWGLNTIETDSDALNVSAALSARLNDPHQPMTGEHGRARRTAAAATEQVSGSDGSTGKARPAAEVITAGATENRAAVAARLFSASCRDRQTDSEAEPRIDADATASRRVPAARRDQDEAGSQYADEAALTPFTFALRDIVISGMRSVRTDGEPLLLLPATNTRWIAWRQQIAFFQRQGFSLYIPHYPGHAGNAMPGGDLTLPAIAEAVQAFLLAQVEKPVYCIGWSLGGCIAQLLALRWPARLRAMILTGTFARYQPQILAGIAALHQELRDYAMLGRLWFPQAASLAAAISADASQAAISRYYLAMSQFDVAASLAEVTTPTLAVRGSEDGVISADQLAWLAAIPGAQTQAVDAGHFLPLTHGQRFNALCHAFLQQVRTQHG